MPNKPVSIEALKCAVLQEAEARRDSAGHNGRMDDGGAGWLENQVKFYTYGQNGEIPEEWNKIAQTLDPEYETYQRLKRKFER